MDHWSPGALFGTLAAAVVALLFLLFRLIGYFRQSARRYFWFELCAGAFLIAFGLFWLLGYPVASWPWRLPFVAVVLAGGIGLFRALGRGIPNAQSTSKPGRV